MSFVAEIQADISNFQSNLDKAQARIDAFANDVGNRIAKVGRSFQIIGGALSIGVTAPFVAAGNAAFKMAADFEDALGATDQIFKEASASTQDWANSLPTYFGIAKKEALEYSNMMGSMLINIGNLTEKEASKQSAKLIELAGDLTAMYGGTTQDAVRALTGALKGNTTMLDNYGMAANDALVKAKAYSMGLVEQGKELDLASRQAATLALIYEQSGAAQGQAAREADGASGSLRALQTEMSNLSTEIGSHLLPIITPLVNYVKDIIAGFRGLSPETQKLIVIVGSVAAAIGPLLVALGSLMQLAPLVGSAFALMTGPVGITVTAIGAAVVLIIKYWDDIKAYFTNGNGSKVWDSISSTAQKLWGNLVEIFNKVKEFVTMVWDKIGSNVMSIVGNTFDTIFAIIGSVVNQIMGVMTVFSSLIRGDFTGAFEAAKNVIKGIFNAIKTIVLNVVGNITQALSGFFKLLGADDWGNSMEKWANGLKPVKEEVQKTGVKIEESTNKINVNTNAVDSNTQALSKNTKAQRDYRSELDNTLASWGIYDSQVKVLTKSFNDLNDVAKKAGATQLEFQTIASKQWADQALLNFKKVGDGFKTVGLENVNTNISMPIRLNPVLANGAYEKVTSDLGKQTTGLVDQVNNILSTGISNGLSGMFANIGEAMATGGNVMQAIGDSLVSGLGNLAKQIGEQMVAFGVAGIALKKLAMNPFLAIAAGAALVALGSFASSSIGRQTANYNGVSTGGYSSSLTSSHNAIPRGSLYNNERQKVEFEISGNKLKGVLNVDNKRNTRLS